MRPVGFLLLSLMLVAFQNSAAKKTWEKDPLGWSEKACQKVLEDSPWCKEGYKPLSGNSHYILKIQWVSPILLFAEAREEQLHDGKDLDFLKATFESKVAEEGLEEGDLIKFRVFPMKGHGMIGQNLHALSLYDPFFEELADNVILTKNNDRDKFLLPLDLKPIGKTLDDGFQLIFENKDFVTSLTKRVDLLFNSQAGEIKVKFDLKKMKPQEFHPEYHN